MVPAEHRAENPPVPPEGLDQRFAVRPFPADQDPVYSTRAKFSVFAWVASPNVPATTASIMSDFSRP